MDRENIQHFEKLGIDPTDGSTIDNFAALVELAVGWVLYEERKGNLGVPMEWKNNPIGLHDVLAEAFEEWAVG